jgi:hypothetical protein
MTQLHPIAMLLACVCIIIAEQTCAQENEGLTDKVISFPSLFLNKVSKKTSTIEHRIIYTSERALKQLSKQEKRLQKKLHKKDSLLAKQLFPDAQTAYQSLQAQLKNRTNNIASRAAYLPFLDTLTTSIRFLEKANAQLDNKKIQQALGQINSMQNRFQQATQIQEYIRNRRQCLTTQFSKLNMAKALMKYNKQVYYYQAQIEEYRSLLKQPDKLERKAIDLLNKTKPFQDFMQKYSILGSLFPVSNNSFNQVTQAALPGLQTTAQVNSLIQQTVAGSDNSMQVLQQNIQQAQDQLQQIKNKVNEVGSNSEDRLPNFRPNSTRVKSFWNRWELGTNLQSTRSNAWLPSATQLGLSAGYKLNDRSVVGIGMAGSIGWGKSIRHIVVSYEGVSARSYADLKLKGSLWITAGYEMNYRTTFTRIEQLQALNAWQQSGLIGISKKYKISKKFKGSMNLLWDYLSYSQVPRTQPLVFRCGYSIK